MKFYNYLKQKGVTLTELLVVLAIIGILATVAIPTYTNKVENARVASATQEVKEIAHAMEVCNFIHGFYVPIQVLDDIPTANGITDSNSDDISQAVDRNIGIIDPLSSVTAQHFSSGTPPHQFNINDSNARVQALVDDWQGPFLDPQRTYDESYEWLDFPLDPWGEPYRWYSPIGIIGTGDYDSPVVNFTQFGDGILTISYDRFDRFAIVSFGKDNTPDLENAVDGDDVIYFFGTVPNESVY